VADLPTLDHCMAAVREKHGRIDVLFVNAGIGAFAPVAEITPELWDEIHAVNLKGCFFAAQKALPLMVRGGSIVITGSIGAEAPVPGNAVYAASKAGLRAATRILGVELLSEGIRVNMVSPGPTETPLINRNKDMPPEAVEGLRRIMIDAVPMKRMGEAVEVARAVLFLASDEASFINGVDLDVDCMELS
jgi:NAD(P)-dependent dehydrogenase (short-subunit alcohol dehydrogenase family)